MQLFHSSNSPFVRKVMVVAHEAGLAGSIEILPSSVGGGARDRAIIAHNPLGQIPTLILDDGTMIADSAVICEYLDARGRAGLIPAGEDRWEALTRQAMADGLMEAAVLWREEDASRPEALRWERWRDNMRDKIDAVLAFFAQDMARLEGRVDIVGIALACGLGYLDYRFETLVDWRGRQPALRQWYESFARRPSMIATAVTPRTPAE